MHRSLSQVVIECFNPGSRWGESNTAVPMRQIRLPINDINTKLQSRKHTNLQLVFRNYAYDLFILSIVHNVHIPFPLVTIIYIVNLTVTPLTLRDSLYFNRRITKRHIRNSPLFLQYRYIL